MIDIRRPAPSYVKLDRPVSYLVLLMEKRIIALKEAEYCDAR